MGLRILLLGRTGQLGHELLRSLGPLGEVIAPSRALDITQVDDLANAVQQAGPQVVINAAAYTAVDQAEAEPDLAHRVNAQAPGRLGQLCAERGAALLHFSTDYVFDGNLGRPYTEDDPPAPLGVYGQTKLDGERAALAACPATLVLRTSWVFGLHRECFLTKVLEWAMQRRRLRFASDVTGSPTWARHLAELTGQLIARAGGDPASWAAAHAGVYHCAGGGVASRLDWAQAILAIAANRSQLTVEDVEAGWATDFPAPARRPMNSALDCGRLDQRAGLRLPPWRDGLRLAMQG